MVISDCGRNYEYAVSSPNLKAGQSFAFGPYRIEVLGHRCDAPQVGDNYGRVRIYKDGSSIGDVTLYIHGENDTYLDNQNLCVSIRYLNCTPGQDPVSSYEAWYSRNVKELVTNMNIPTALVRTIVAAEGEYQSEYLEGENRVYVFRMNANLTQLGAGAGLSRLVGTATGRAIIATAIIALGAGAIVWFWRDVETTKYEIGGQLSDDALAAIQAILDNPDLTPEQKSAAIQEVLRTYENVVRTIYGSEYGGIVNALLMMAGLVAGVMIIKEVTK